MQKILPFAAVCLIALPGCAMEAGATRGGNSSGPLGWVDRAEKAKLSSVRGDRRNAIAWAPLADPDEVTVEGSVPSSRAWSTSKVLIVAAYLDTVVDGDPDKIPTDDRASIRAALAESDDAAIRALRRDIPDPVAAMRKILLAVGDTTTIPRAAEGTMRWSVREQVRFMAALGNGRVVSPRASSFLLREMQPIDSQRWGLGTIGARSFKPGWFDSGSESRQMGIVGDFAVAIITAGASSPSEQGVADNAHATQLTRLALLLADRLDQARCPRLHVAGQKARWCWASPL